MARRQPVAIYTYRECGDPFARKKKFVDEQGAKDFSWEHVTGIDERGEYVWAPGVPKDWDVGLYRSDDLIRARAQGLPVHITEGEKDADRLREARPKWVVVSRPHGAKTWTTDWHDALRGASKVFVYADDDADGHAGAARAARALEADDFNVKIRLPAKGTKDVYEHLESEYGDAWRTFKRADWPADRRALRGNAPASPSSSNDGGQRLLAKAASRLAEHGRNDTGIWLALQLRDGRLDRVEAERLMVEQYVPTANAIKPATPAYSEEEARESVRQAYSRDAREPAPDSVPHETWDDFGNAQRLVNLYGDRLKWVSDIKSWAVYDKRAGLWVPRSDESATGLARKVVERAEVEEAETYPADAGSGSKGDASARAEFRTWIKRQRSADRVGAMIRIAKSKKTLRATFDQFDAEPNLLHCANGVLDLRTRELLPFSQEHLSTVSTGVAYEPDATDDLWQSYLDTFLPDIELQKFVQRVMGYALLEGNPERLFVIVCGGTSSGKSTLNEAVMAAMGGYARPFNLTVFRANKDEKPRADLADILHRRYVATVEASADWHLHADQIKRITGGDKLAARYPWDRADTVRVPAFVPYIFTNAVPTIQGRDRALDRRLMVLPFERTISPKDDRAGAREQLAASESARRAVLAWLVDGLSDYLTDGGLGKVPKVVRAAIEDAKFSFSDIDRFFSEMCEFGDDYEVRPSEIYEAYTRWSHAQGIPEKEIVSNPKFGTSLANRGYEKVKGYPDGPGTRRTWVRRGIRLKKATWRP